MVLALALIGPTACGGGDEAAGDGSDASPRTLRIVATDPSRDEAELAAPATASAGLTEIVLENRGDVLHDAQLFRIDGAHSAEDLVNELLEAADSAPKPGWAHPVGGVAALRPGESRSVVQVLAPGRYLIADTQERPTRKVFKSTNALKGGIAEIEVTGEIDGALPAPPAGARLAATDKGFDDSRIVSGADRTLRFENRGKEWHQAVFFPVSEGESYEEAGQRLFDRRGDTGWVPVDVPAERATAVLEPGAEQLVDLSLRKGKYLIACFVSDRGGGPSHFATTLSGLEVP
jgi:hypothetical protein